MTVTAPPLDTAGAQLDAQIAAIEALLAPTVGWTADSGVTVDSTLLTADGSGGVALNTPVIFQYQQMLNRAQVAAVDHYMVTGWLNAAAILAAYDVPAWDVIGQAMKARVAYLQNLVDNPPTMPPGNAAGYGSAGWTTILQNYQQQLYEAQISLVEHLMDLPGGTTAATMLAGMTGVQSFPFQYTSNTGVIGPSVTPPGPPPPPPPPAKRTIGGVLSGMTTGPITLQNNGADNLTLSSNGAFAFPVQVADGDSYNVTILSAAPGQDCTVSAGSGIVNGVTITSVQVACVTPAPVPQTIGGTLSGLDVAGTVVLQNNGGDDLSLSANGPFTFATPLLPGATYAVTVLTDPAGQSTGVSNGSGTVVNAPVTSVGVSCVDLPPPPFYSIGGTLSGLSGGSVVLQNNGGDNLTLSANGAFTFATQIETGNPYSVTVLTNPSGQICTISNGAGTVASANITNVGASCATAPPATQRYNPGIWVAISYAQRGLGPNGVTQGADSGSFSYTAGTVSSPLTITGNYSDGTIPGGHTGTKTVSGVNGGAALVRNTHGPAVFVDSSHKTVGVIVRYPWNDIEGPSANQYHFTQMDADLAQCIALGIQWVPMLVQRTFGAAETATDAGNSIYPVGWPASSGGGAPAGNPMPYYLRNYASLNQGASLYQSWRWDLVNVAPRMRALITKVCQRYDMCVNFGGCAGQETANSADPAGSFSPDNYCTAWVAEAAAHFAASPNSRMFHYQNYMSGTSGGPKLDQACADVQQYGCVLLAPDDVIGGGTVYNTVFTSGSGTKAGRFYGYALGGTIGSGVKFNSTGPTGVAVQRAEWIGISPAQGSQALADSLLYAQGGNPAGSKQPNFLKCPILVVDWHTSTTDGSPNYNGHPQSFIGAGADLIKNTAIPWAGSWTP